MTIGTMTRAAGRRSRRVPPPAGIVATAGSSAACLGAGGRARGGEDSTERAALIGRGEHLEPGQRRGGPSLAAEASAEAAGPPYPASGGLLRALAELGGQAGQERALLGRDLIDAEQTAGSGGD